MITPAEKGYLLQKLADRVAALEEQLGVVMRLVGAIGQQAKVVAFTTGSAQCTVQFLATGTRAPMPYLFGYTPAVGHGGHVVDLGSGLLFIPASAF